MVEQAIRPERRCEELRQASQEQTEAALRMASLDWPSVPSTPEHFARTYAFLVAELALQGIDDWS